MESTEARRQRRQTITTDREVALEISTALDIIDQNPLLATMTNVLSFDKGAWDDRELINAYDASLLEFHVSQSGSAFN